MAGSPRAGRTREEGEAPAAWAAREEALLAAHVGEARGKEWVGAGKAEEGLHQDWTELGLEETDKKDNKDQARIYISTGIKRSKESKNPSFAVRRLRQCRETATAIRRSTEDESFVPEEPIYLQSSIPAWPGPGTADSLSKDANKGERKEKNSKSSRVAVRMTKITRHPASRPAA